ncbi:MAG: poly(3-hydroxybutyrate) depolymerase [Bradymonadia bacterium]
MQSGVNTITTSGSNRTFEVFLPSDTSDMAVTFFWYGTGGSGQDYSWLQGFASGYDLAIVVPQAAGSLTFEWPVMGSDNTAAELTFVDDMVACVTETLDVDTTKIYTSGFSAGALWSSYLVMQRSNYLASAAIFSGGTGSLVRTYETPEVSIPILGFHGGDADVYGGFVNFKDQMTQFLGNLDTDGHFIVVCDHGEGHTIPNGALDGAFQFLTDHSYGDTASPHASTLPAFLPDYCRYW